MRKLLLSTILLAAFGSHAEGIDPLQLTEEFNLVSVQDVKIVKPAGWESDCSVNNNAAKSFGLEDLINSGEITTDMMINLGKAAWKVLKENEPVFTSSTTSASALPKGISCWNQLSNWSRTRVETYQVKYKNMYGITVVDLEFSLLYNYGGQLNGKGRYLTNATVNIGTADVMWGYIVNANVEVPQVVNMGSVENPVAGMQVNFSWDVNTRPISLRTIKKSTVFSISGDGSPTQVLH